MTSLVGVLILAAHLGSTTYSVRNVQGWTLHIRTELLDSADAVATRKAVGLLGAQLKQVRKIVPKAAVVALQKVPLYFTPQYPNTVPAAAYHPGAAWLRENGRDPAMEKCVEFTNIAIFEDECRRMPMFVLHELAHAYHDRVLPGGFGNPAVSAAFEKARASGVYDKVERKDARGKITLDKAYALTNPMEYFAESTEAFFGENDFYPFNRWQLQQADPEMCRLLERLWNSTEQHEREKTPPVFRRRFSAPSFGFPLRGY